MPGARTLLLALAIAIVGIVSSVAFLFTPEPAYTFLTWETEDTSHNMVVNYATTQQLDKLVVYYDSKPRQGQLKQYAHAVSTTLRQRSGITLKVHSAKLHSLQSGKDYYFVVSDGDSVLTDERKFQTVPETGAIRFIAGGDTRITPALEQLTQLAAETRPHFAVIGGDIAYADGDPEKQSRWQQLLAIWQRNMITPDGYTIPVIAAVGNHDVNTAMLSVTQADYQPDINTAPFYELLFHPAGDKSFFKRRLGEHGVLLVLDTEHVYPADGEQRRWLQTSLQSQDTGHFRFAAYHVPLYPSYYPADGAPSQRLRQFWLPLFDRYALDLAFENHEHTLKKTYRLKNNQRSNTDDGTIYIGDGNWGTDSRTPKQRWYMENIAPLNHVWLVTLDSGRARVEPISTSPAPDTFAFELQPRNR